MNVTSKKKKKTLVVLVWLGHVLVSTVAAVCSTIGRDVSANTPRLGLSVEKSSLTTPACVQGSVSTTL